MKAINFWITLCGCISIVTFIVGEILASAGSPDSFSAPHWLLALMLFSLFMHWLRQLVTSDYT